MSDLKTLGAMYEMNTLDTVVAKKYLSLLRDTAYNLVTRLNKTKVYTKEELELIDKIQKEKQVNKDKIDINYSSSLQKKIALTNEISNRLDEVVRLYNIDLKHAEEDNRIIVELENETNPVAAAQASSHGPIQSRVLTKGRAIWRTKTRSRKSRKPKTRKSRKNRNV